VVPPRLTPSKQKSLCDATGRGCQRHSFRYAANWRLYPCSITGAAELGYLLVCSPVQLGGPFDFCAFALLSDCSHSRPRARLSGNRFEVYLSSSAFFMLLGGILCERHGCVKGGHRTESDIPAEKWAFRSGWDFHQLFD